MRRFLSCLLPSVVALLLCVAAAPACINDREAETHEKEFKSQYLKEPVAPSTEQPSAPGVNPRDIALGGAGVALLAGAVVIGLKVVGRR